MKKFDKVEARNIVEVTYDLGGPLMRIEDYQSNQDLIISKLHNEFGNTDEVQDFIDFEISKITAVIHLKHMLPEGPHRDQAIAKIESL